MMSIRSRLLIWLLSALIVAVSIAGAAVYRKTLSSVDEMQDYALKQIAYSLQYSNKFTPPTVVKSTDSDNEQVEGSADNEDFEFVGQMWAKNGNLIFSSPPGKALPHFTIDGIATVTWEHQQWRLFSITTRNKVIQVGQPFSARTQAAVTIAEQALLPITALIPALGILIWISVSYGLRPLARIATDLGERHVDSMQPIALRQLPQEIRLMVAALNALLKRLADSFRLQRNFIADAAHQLRTPLTALHLQAEIMSRSTDEAEVAAAFYNLKQGIARSTRLVEQMLSLARQQPEAGRKTFVRVDLVRLAKCVVGEIAPLAEARNIDLGLVSEGEAFVFGNGDALMTLLINLIDNAIRYIPEGKKIDVSIDAKETGITLEVRDNGPGIPVEEMEMVFDRFYRALGNNVIGSGLGLAIVKSITDAHGAKITLSENDGKSGLMVRIVFLPE